MRLHSALRHPALPRQRTLAATLDWSIGLLNPSELLLFRMLSVFRAHFDVEAALGVVANELDPDVASDALISLAGKSLVVYDPGSEAHAPTGCWTPRAAMPTCCWCARASTRWCRGGTRG